ncbi:MAG: hypothetical protein JNK58_04580 [Phycisphaerae bacterium]|nr:hypothetical protein [Phycisphaerae bacterium]
MTLNSSDFRWLRSAGDSFFEARAVVAAWCAAGCTMLALSGSASAADTPAGGEGRAVLIDDQLASRSIIVVSLDERLLEFVDEQQRQRTLTRAAVLALIPEVKIDTVPQRNRAARASGGGMLELTDGQRFEGDLTPTGGTDQSLAWRHPILGQLSFPIEHALSFWRPSAPEALRASSASAVTSDTLFLNNQDQLSGFLASAGDPIRIETPEGVIDLPPERVVGAVLANPRRAAAGARVWLDGGTAVNASRLTIDASLRSSFVLEHGASAMVVWSQLRAISFDSGRLVPLASIAPLSQSAAAGRRYAPPIRLSGSAPLDAQDIVMPGPMSVTWTLPDSARRLSFTAMLGEGTAPWGDCEVIVTIDGGEVARRRLNTDAPAASISVPVNGHSLTITVDSGRFGPIRDWVILGRPMILVGAPSGSVGE